MPLRHESLCAVFGCLANAFSATPLQVVPEYIPYSKEVLEGWNACLVNPFDCSTHLSTPSNAQLGKYSSDFSMGLRLIDRYTLQ